MKILYYSPHPLLNLSAATGYGTHMREMIGAFKDLGHDVTTCIMGGVVSDNKDEKALSGGILKNIFKKIIPNLLWQTLKDINLLRFDNFALKELDKAVKKDKPDLIYERGFYMMTSGVKIAERYGITHILEINAPYLEEKVQLEGRTLLFGKAGKRELEQYHKTNKIVVVSSSLKNYIEKKNKAFNSKIIITPNAVNLSKINTDESEISEIREKYDIRENATVIGFVGSIFPYHGVDKLIKSFANVINIIKDKELMLFIVGDGKVLEDLKKLSINLNIQKNVIFTGSVPYDKVYNYISLMDITVLPQTNWYCSPVKIFEYGVMGKAVISIDAPGVKDVMEDKKEGIIINEHKNSLEDAIIILTGDKNYRIEIAEKFKEKILKNYTWEKSAEKILQ